MNMHIIFAALLAAATMVQPKLVDQTGHTFTFDSLRGAPLAVTFVSAHCSDACPLINAQFSAAAGALKKAHLRLRLLSVTLDPERDSLSDLRKLSRTFSADPRAWLIAGGDVKDVHEVMNAFGVVTQRGSDGFEDAHTTLVYLIDGHGVLRKTILPSRDLSGQLVDEMRTGALAR